EHCNSQDNNACMMTVGSLFFGLNLLSFFLLRGSLCLRNDICAGRKVLHNRFGVITDGPKNYTEYLKCEWLIDAGSPNKTIHLRFDNMITECSFDFLFIYDGNSYNSHLIASLSGDSHPDDITAYSGHMLIYLFSDRNYVKLGFVAHYEVLDCPWNCSNRGVCNNNICHCDAGYSGKGCEAVNCPDNCGPHGNCTFQSHGLSYCKCSPGYVGHKCDIPISSSEIHGQWYVIQNATGRNFPPRTSHTSVYTSSCIWMFGGFNLNRVLDELWRYCMSENVWENLTRLLKKTGGDWPSPRSGHAMDVYGDGFYIFGGLLNNGSHSDELWFFNISSMTWSLCANESFITPEKVTEHTLTTVDDFLFVVGGKTEERVYIDSIFKISAKSPEQWESVSVKGGKYPTKRLVGHSTLYHRHSRSLIVFGGYKQESALFSDRSNIIHMFSIDDLYWSQLHNNNWLKESVPRDRAYHSAVLMGNYMAVYGGNSHRHEELEICYSNEIYFYHLGCHVWLNHTYFSGNASTGGLPLKGRFGHSAVVANGNVMLIMGGYSGRVMGDLIAYKVPTAIADFKCSPEEDSCQTEDNILKEFDHCQKYPSNDLHLCLLDPECIHCNTSRSDVVGPLCVHRTLKEHCVGTLLDLPDRCPGICPALHTCGACISQGKGVELTSEVQRRSINIQQCSWCVKEAQCQMRSAPSGTCRAANETVSGIVGWWGGLSAKLTSLIQCQTEDFPAGLHFVKYRAPANNSYPDELNIHRKTIGTMGYIVSKRIEQVYFLTSKFLGFIHPLNAKPNSNENLTLQLSLQHAKAKLFLSVDDSEANLELVIKREEEGANNYITAIRAYNRTVFPNVTRGHRYFMEQTTEQTRSSDITTAVTIAWNGYLSSTDKVHPITYEFLEPFSNGNCSSSYNCLGCLTDTLCGWCEMNRRCFPRNVSEGVCQDGIRQQYMITSPSECPDCESHVQCTTCAADPLCEWVIDTGHCSRRFRHPDKAVRDSNKCSPPCHERTKCRDCITSEKGDCAWCENTQLCLPFSDYVTRYIYGQCTSWIDISNANVSCRSCRDIKTCDKCLKEFGCGWCSNVQNPLKGICVEGDFASANSNESCLHDLTQTYNLSASGPFLWSYGVCPDVDECALDLHKCHPNATCINGYGSYRCVCNRGFAGDGSYRCDETCFYDCHNGKCSGPPDFKCICDLGWTNNSCDVNCGCNNHSTCNTGLGICDECMHNTAGNYCDECRPGSYRNPLDTDGCYPCKCNGHGDHSLGECNRTTGQCFCTDNTKGFYCEQCQPAYYGNPSMGGRCYLRCDNRIFLSNVTDGALGSYNGSGMVDGGHSYCLWILSVFPDIMYKPIDMKPVPVLSFTVEGYADIECGLGALQVYSGIPDFVFGSVSDKMESQPIGEFCGQSSSRGVTVYGTQGTITVLFEGYTRRSRNKGHSGRFNATYHAHICSEHCQGNHMCVDGRCICKEGYWGHNCTLHVCPSNCSEDAGQGYCMNGICICYPGFTGVTCSQKISLNEMKLQLITDSALAGSPLWPYTAYGPFADQAQGPSPRSGHTLTSCGQDLIFLYGGYNPAEGILNDMWVFNASVKTWSLIVPALQPKTQGSYYHAAACIPLLKMIYIFGGLMKFDSGEVSTSNQLWKFNIESHAWTEDNSAQWLPALAGHTLTNVGPTNLIMVGGFSSENYFNDKVYEYNVSTGGKMAWQEHSDGNMLGLVPIGIYGHSAVFDPSPHILYIFGGFIFMHDGWKMSHYLLALDVRDRSWSFIDPEPSTKLENRAFHSAVHMNNFMVVMGGITSRTGYLSDVLVYRYSCNTWLKFDFFDYEEEEELIPLPVYGVALAAVVSQHDIYIFGGYVGVHRGTLFQLTLPPDLCTLIKDNMCNVPGCQKCSVPSETGDNKTVCLDATRKFQPSGFCGDSHGRQLCDLSQQALKRCSRHTTCSECLFSHPRVKEQSCKWCSSCVAGRSGQCVPHTESCPVHSCLQPAVSKILLDNTAQFNQQPVFIWSCVSKNLKESATSRYFYSESHETCPERCHRLKTCDSCLRSNGSEGGSSECVWSEMLQQCMPPAYVPLRCSLGECQFVRSRKESTCPIPCDTFTKCADCIASPGCGWCAFGGMNGLGVCMPGGIMGPAKGGVCSDGNFSGSEIGKSELHAPRITQHIWSYDQCQPENECMNNHHTCNNVTQNCYDTLEHFRCDCKEGYILINNKCEPVCHQSCVKGVCIKPDTCQCDFGYVGGNCSVECKCNKHSNCKSERENDKCLKCENNTQGERCEKCLRGFVGNPKDGDRCKPCREYCYNHTDNCMSRDEYNYSLAGGSKSPTFFENTQAHCFHCEHNTTGEYCGTCIPGHFRRASEPRTNPCRECQCNGHSNVCNADTGENCQCKNNTETNCGEKDVECWKLQCASCKEYFIGEPKNGQQCYRQMNVDRDYCFDPDTQNNCNQYPKALHMGRTVFFVVQPKYLNVDIRITIDVTLGSADVFLANYREAYQVFNDESYRMHNIFFNKDYASERAGEVTRRSVTVNSDSSVDEDAYLSHQRHASGSVHITDKVPDYMKLKPADRDYYKLSQFESVKREPSKSGLKAKKKGGNGKPPLSDDDERDDVDSPYKDYNEENEMEVLQGRKIYKNPQHGKLKGTGSRHQQKNSHHELNRQKSAAHAKAAADLGKFLSIVDNESTLPQHFFYSHLKSRNHAPGKKRQRRGTHSTDSSLPQRGGTVVTDGNKEDKHFPSGIRMGEVDAGELNTYITVSQQNSVLVVRDVRFRLVITLPRDQHDLKSSKFFIIIRSRGGSPNNTTYGNLYFRQDQPHIDLFVFFSVFFSCFFLFLAVCVLLWKMKQTFDARRSRQMREREMECMASRPFARILVLIEHDDLVYLPLSLGVARRRSRLSRYRNQYYNNNDINTIACMPPPRELRVIPIAIEPTEDGLASVGTVLFQLPGGSSAPAQLCLGSALTTRINPPVLVQKCTNIRRRTSASSC
ncbi:Multiple epidermal growth factor-like domains protein 8, partial [Bulinus truncatus]